MNPGRKKTMGCPHCGCRVSGQEGTCPRCGRDLRADAQLKCPFCGGRVTRGDIGCPVCGMALPKTSGTELAEQKRVIKKPTPKRGAKPKKQDALPKCPECSAPIESIGSTCPSCGFAPSSEEGSDKAGKTPVQEEDDDRSACPVCGTEVSVKDERCSFCGAEFEPEEEPAAGEPAPPQQPVAGAAVPEPDEELADCPVCGATVTITSTKCPKCGAEFEPEEPDEEPAFPTPEAEPDREIVVASEDEAECPICGSVTSLSDKACPFCGAEFEPEEAETTVPEAEDEGVLCPVCGRVVGTSIEVCPHCGAEFEPEEAPQEVPAAVPEVAAVAEEDEVLCPVCGNRVGAQVASCPHCGVEFEAEEEADVQASMFAFTPPPKPSDADFGIVRPRAGRSADGRRGISNGTSAINGVSLVNGMGGAAGPSRINGVGATNGMDLINGRGLSNGGAVNGRRMGPRSRRTAILRRWQFLVIIVACGLIVPAAVFLTVDRDESPFSVDGDFDDWRDESKLSAMYSADSSSINIVEWSVATYSGTLYLYIETEKPMMAGETAEGFVLFIDADGSSETGYSLAEMGAEAMMDVQGWNGTVSSSLCSVYGSSDDRLDWNSWGPRGSVACSLDGSRLEASAKMPVRVNSSSKVMVVSMDEDGPGCRSCPAAVEGGLLMVEQIPSTDIASDGILEISSEAALSTLRFTCYRSGGSVESVMVQTAGVALTGSIGPFTLSPGQQFDVSLRADTSALPSGRFVSATLTAADVVSSFAQVHITGVGAKAYVGAPPGNVSIDGAFADWVGRTIVDVDASPVENPNIDIVELGGANDTDMSYFFVSVQGEMCMGSYVPKACAKPVPGGNGTVVPVRRTGEDFLMIYVDTDGSSGTGYRINSGWTSIGADRLIEVSGMCGKVNDATFSMYVDGEWIGIVSSMHVEIDRSRIEIGADYSLMGDEGLFEFVVVTTDWRKEQDLALFVPGMGIGTKSIEPIVATDARAAPFTENLPEFRDVVVPVSLLLVVFMVVSRRRRMAAIRAQGIES